MGDFEPFCAGEFTSEYYNPPTATGAANGSWRIGIFLSKILILILPTPEVQNTQGRCPLRFLMEAGGREAAEIERGKR